MTKEERSTKEATMQHIGNVRHHLHCIIDALEERAASHDYSKLEDPEFDTFVKYTPKLATSTYGSDEYKQFLKEMQPALDHHYAVNRHHPEHFKKYVCNGCFEEYIHEPNVCCKCGYSQFQVEADVSQMNLVDLIEMLCDWKSATLRHNDGNISKSIEINRERFKIADQLAVILHNTVTMFSYGSERSINSGNK